METGGAERRAPGPEERAGRGTFIGWLRARKLRELFTRKLLKTMAMGQGLSLLICGTALSSQYLAVEFHVNTPMLQSLIHYALLCVTYTTTLAFRRDSKDKVVEVFAFGSHGRGGELHGGESVPVHHPDEHTAARLLCDPGADGSVLVHPEDPFPHGALRGRVHLPSGCRVHGWGRFNHRERSRLHPEYFAGRRPGADQRHAVRHIQRVPGVHGEDLQPRGVPRDGRPLRDSDQQRSVCYTGAQGCREDRVELECWPALRSVRALHVCALQLHASGGEADQCHRGQPVLTDRRPLQPLLWTLPLSIRFLRPVHRGVRGDHRGVRDVQHRAHLHSGSGARSLRRRRDRQPRLERGGGPAGGDEGGAVLLGGGEEVRGAKRGRDKVRKPQRALDEPRAKQTRMDRRTQHKDVDFINDTFLYPIMSCCSVCLM